VGRFRARGTDARSNRRRRPRGVHART
jgi:hypothetical protein